VFLRHASSSETGNSSSIRSSNSGKTYPSTSFPVNYSLSSYHPLPQSDLLNALFKNPLVITPIRYSIPPFLFRVFVYSRSQWPSNLRHGSAADRLLGLRVRIPPGASMFVCCECCVWSGRGLCDGPIPRPEVSYRLCGV
jgi:hypothetical protein